MKEAFTNGWIMFSDDRWVNIPARYFRSLTIEPDTEGAAYVRAARVDFVLSAEVERSVRLFESDLGIETRYDFLWQVFADSSIVSLELDYRDSGSFSCIVPWRDGKGFPPCNRYQSFERLENGDLRVGIVQWETPSPP